MNWSPDCRYITIGGYAQISYSAVYMVGSRCFELMLRMLDGQKQNPDLWQDSPINLISINEAINDTLTMMSRQGVTGQ